MPGRCALRCPPSGTRIHCFADPKKHLNKFLTWINLRICDIRFSAQDKNRYNRVNALAVPTLHLPADSDYFLRDHIFYLTEKIMRKETPNINVKLTILSYADMIIDFPLTINILLHSWCRSINRILSGKIVYHGDDITKNAAQKYYNKHRHYRNKK
ncbi:hypothetical protein ABMA27_002540 [Loxostege sticticalis]|uniref:Uncharacterized protein n=1 Tax=Loxostege sticticalis TaxID=481309 RepID=A0ABR3HU04_LOXSC